MKLDEFKEWVKVQIDLSKKTIRFNEQRAEEIDRFERGYLLALIDVMDLLELALKETV